MSISNCLEMWLAGKRIQLMVLGKKYPTTLIMNIDEGINLIFMCCT